MHFKAAINLQMDKCLHFHIVCLLFRFPSDSSIWRFALIFSRGVLALQDFKCCLLVFSRKHTPWEWFTIGFSYFNSLQVGNMFEYTTFIFRLYENEVKTKERNNNKKVHFYKIRPNFLLPFNTIFSDLLRCLEIIRV